MSFYVPLRKTTPPYANHPGPARPALSHIPPGRTKKDARRRGKTAPFCPDFHLHECVQLSNPSFPSQEPIPEPPFALSRVCDKRRCAPPCDNPCGSGRTLSSTKEMKVFKCWKRSKTMQEIIEKKDVYARITSQIVAQLEKGVRPWSKPWNAEHAAGRITRPLRHNGQPYSGINILSLWMSALGQNFTAPIWMTFRQATELNAHVRKGEKGSLVVYANAITRTEHDDKTGEDVDREIPYMKGYTVFNVEQIEGLPEIFYAKAAPTRDPVARIEHAEAFFASMGATIKHGGNRAYY